MTPKPSKEALDLIEALFNDDRLLKARDEEVYTSVYAEHIDRAISAHASKYEKIARELHKALRQDWIVQENPRVPIFACKSCSRE